MPMHISQYEQVLGGLPRTIHRVMTQDKFESRYVESRYVEFENKMKVKQWLRSIRDNHSHQEFGLVLQLLVQACTLT